MTTVTSPVQLENIAIDALATCPDPAAWHEALRSLGTHARADQWIISTPLDVAAALAEPALRVMPPPTAAGPAADLIARMARFSDGEAHLRRRALTVQLLPTVREVAGHAADGAAAYLREHASAGPLDVMPLACTLPAWALARALGLSAPDAALAAELTGRLCEALLSAPRLTTPAPAAPRPAAPAAATSAPSTSAAGAPAAGAPATAPPATTKPNTASEANAAASQLCTVLRRLPLNSEDEIAAAASILFQARDATAALIGAAVLTPAPGEHGQTAVRVESALRREAPVQCTRRVAATQRSAHRSYRPGLPYGSSWLRPSSATGRRPRSAAARTPARAGRRRLRSRARWSRSSTQAAGDPWLASEWSTSRGRTCGCRARCW